jgi:hypothetical protein
VTNLGASLGTALIGSVLISALTASVVAGLQSNPDVPAQVAESAPVELAGGVPFLSDAQLEESLADAGVTGDSADAVVEVNSQARLEALRSAFAVVTLLAVGSLFLTRRLPDQPPGAAEAAAPGELAGAPPDREQVTRP